MSNIPKANPYYKVDKTPYQRLKEHELNAPFNQELSDLVNEENLDKSKERGSFTINSERSYSGDDPAEAVDTTYRKDDE
jgi:hypothetical protein